MFKKLRIEIRREMSKTFAHTAHMGAHCMPRRLFHFMFYSLFMAKKWENILIFSHKTFYMIELHTDINNFNVNF